MCGLSGQMSTMVLFFFFLLYVVLASVGNLYLFPHFVPWFIHQISRAPSRHNLIWPRGKMSLFNC